jgi:creatinine amidohydrolase/Fe(II)-dependent formamide hydrolase-like protein
MRLGAAAATRDDVLVAPALAHGSSGEHAALPGTLSLGRRRWFAELDVVLDADRVPAAT